RARHQPTPADRHRHHGPAAPGGPSPAFPQAAQFRRAAVPLSFTTRCTLRPMDGPARRESQVSARREAILEAAKAAFLEDGYQLASMDRIAERAGTTKRTVYDHFKSKPALFAAVVERGCEAMTAALPAPETLPANPRLGLPTFAAKCVELAAAPATVRLQRLVAAEAERH